jgi:Fic family protein
MCALNTWGSNAIDGNDLTRPQVETLVILRLSIADQPVWKVLETVQHARVFLGLFDRVSDPITVTTALELHDEVLRGVLDRHGMLREEDILIPSSHFVPPVAARVEEEMSIWESEYRSGCKAGEPVIELAARMHQRFEAIHPFTGGNGRTGRLLMNLHFLKHDWPPVNIGLADRQRYFDALEAGHGGDLGPLEDFIGVVMGRSLVTLLDLVGVDEDVLKPLEEMEERGEGFLAYSEHMAEEGKLPAVRVGNTWHSSMRALELFNENG